MPDGPLIMTDIFTYISPLCLIALFFFCFCRFLARPCIPTRSSRSDSEFVTQTVVVSQRDGRRRERNHRRRRSRTMPATSRVQPAGQMPPIQLFADPGDFPDIIIVRSGDEPPKYEDAIKLKDAAPPAYTPAVLREGRVPPAYVGNAPTVSESRPPTVVIPIERIDANQELESTSGTDVRPRLREANAEVLDTRNAQSQCSRTLRRTCSLPDTSRTRDAARSQALTSAQVVLSVEQLSGERNASTSDRN